MLHGVCLQVLSCLHHPSSQAWRRPAHVRPEAQKRPLRQKASLPKLPAQRLMYSPSSYYFLFNGLPARNQTHCYGIKFYFRNNNQINKPTGFGSVSAEVTGNRWRIDVKDVVLCWACKNMTVGKPTGQTRTSMLSHVFFLKCIIPHPRCPSFPPSTQCLKPSSMWSMNSLLISSDKVSSLFSVNSRTRP